MGRSAALVSKRKYLINKIREGHVIPCYICYAQLTVKTATLDHVIPRSKGGTSSSSNIRFCCLKCNQEKGDKPYTGKIPPIWRPY